MAQTRHFVLLHLFLTLWLVRSYGVSQRTTTLCLGNERYVSRPYSPSRDCKPLREICRDVYGGTDDLPTRAQSLHNDPNCEFLVLENQANGDLVAAGNLERMGNEESCFIEGIRVSPRYEGKGVCTLWMRELVRKIKAQTSVRKILSCTIDSNEAMKCVFAKSGVDMVPVNGFRNPDWERLSGLPGWKTSTLTEPQNLLEALRLDHLVSNASRNAGVWEPVSTYEELQEDLEKLAVAGGTIGHLPSVGKPMVLSENLRDSLRKGLVRKLIKPQHDAEDPFAIFALVRNKEASCGVLKSNYVCSIVAPNGIDFDAALWEACLPKYVPLLGGIASFPCVFEQPHPSVPFEKGSLQAALPVQNEKVFINYRWEDEKEVK